MIRGLAISVYLLTFGGFFLPPILALAGLINLAVSYPFGVFAIGIGLGIIVGTGVYERRVLKLPLVPQKIVCSSCGRENSFDASFCDKCGKKMQS